MSLSLFSRQMQLKIEKFWQEYRFLPLSFSVDRQLEPNTVCHLFNGICTNRHDVLESRESIWTHEHNSSCGQLIRTALQKTAEFISQIVYKPVLKKEQDESAEDSLQDSFDLQTGSQGSTSLLFSWEVKITTFPFRSWPHDAFSNKTNTDCWEVINGWRLSHPDRNPAAELHKPQWRPTDACPPPRTDRAQTGSHHCLCSLWSMSNRTKTSH